MSGTVLTISLAAVGATTFHQVNMDQVLNVGTFLFKDNNIQLGLYGSDPHFEYIDVNGVSLDGYTVGVKIYKGSDTNGTLVYSTSRTVYSESDCSFSNSTLVSYFTTSGPYYLDFYVQTADGKSSGHIYMGVGKDIAPDSPYISSINTYIDGYIDLGTSGTYLGDLTYSFADNIATTLTVKEYFDGTLGNTYTKTTSQTFRDKMGVITLTGNVTQYTLDWSNYFTNATKGIHCLRLEFSNGTKTTNVNYIFAKGFPPSITGGSNLGSLYTIPTALNYTVTDPDSTNVNISFLLDGKSFDGGVTTIAPGTYSLPDLTSTFDSMNTGTHTLSATVSNSEDYDYGIHKGAKSTTTWTFTKAVNPYPPVISGSDGTLGTVYHNPVLKYTVTDGDDSSVVVKEYWDNNLIGTYTRATGSTQYTFGIANYYIDGTPGNHQIKITAYDGKTTTSRGYLIVRPSSIVAFTNYGTTSLGVVNADVKVNFTVNNLIGAPTSFIAKIDNTIFQNTTPATLEVSQSITIPYNTIANLTQGNHTLNITATDTSNNTATLTYSFSTLGAPIIFVNNQQIINAGTGSIVTGSINLGNLQTAPTISYYAVNPANNVMTITELWDTMNETLISYANDQSAVTHTALITNKFNNATAGNHYMTIKAYDPTIGQTTQVKVNFNKLVAYPPVISGSDSDLGILYSSKDITYTITDQDSSTFTVTEYFDSSVLGTYTKYPTTTYTVTDWATLFNSASVGTHTIKIQVSDGTNTVNRIYTFTKATNPISFVNYGNLSLGTISSSTTVTFTIKNTLSNVTNAVVNLDGTTISTLSPATLDTPIQITVPTSTITALKKGNHAIVVTATDSANFTNSLTYTFSKANSLPVISTTKVDYGTIIDAPIINYNVAELDGDTLTATYKLDGTFVTTKTVSTGSVSFDTTSYFSNWATGDHTLTVVVSDGTGYSNTLSFTFKKVASYIVLSTPSTSLGLFSQPFSFTFTCANVLNNVTNVTVTMDSESTPYLTFNAITLNSSTTVNIDSTKYSAITVGSHTINLKATDVAGNIATKAITFTKDSSVPVISGIDTDLGKVNIAPEFSYKITDPNNQANTITISIDNTNIVTNQSVTLGTTYVKYITTEFAGLSEGVHTLKIVTTNGSKSATRTYTFTKINKVIVATTTKSNLGNLSAGFSFDYTVTNQLALTTNYTVSIDNILYQNSAIAVQNSPQTFTINTDTFNTFKKGDHSIVVNFVDSKSNSSSLTYTFTKNAIAPIISGIDTDLGDVSIAPQISYIVTDADNDPVDVTINFDSTVIETIKGIELGKLNNLLYSSQFTNALLGKHTITITAKAPTLTTVRTYTFNKLSTSITVTMDMNQIHAQMNKFENIKMNILDTAGPQVTMNVYFDNVKVDEILTINNGDYTYNMSTDIWNSISNGLKQVKLEFVSHTNGTKANIIFTMNKVGGYIDFMLKTPITISDSIYRVLVSAEYYVSPGAILQVLITNDAYAINPVWEDMTTSFLNNDYHIFTNTTINGLRPGMNIRFKVDVGNSTELSWIGRFGIFSE